MYNKKATILILFIALFSLLALQVSAQICYPTGDPDELFYPNKMKNDGNEEPKFQFLKEIEASDDKYGYVISGAGNDFARFTFPSINIQGSSTIKAVYFEIEYHTDTFNRSKGNDHIDDFYIYNGSGYQYISDWGRISSTDLVWRSPDVKDILDEPSDFNMVDVLFEWNPSQQGAKLYVDTARMVIAFSDCIWDWDLDGYDEAHDCNDENPNIHPGAQELCNGIDDNCDGNIDESFNVGISCNSAANSCSDTNAGQIVCSADKLSSFCNAIQPAERAGFGDSCISEPNNCGETSAGHKTCAAVGVACDAIKPADRPTLTLFADSDGDSYGNILNPIDATCGIPAGAVANSNDCNDNDASVYPGAFDIPYDGIDQNCDGADAVVDADGDGFDSNNDCNDADASVHPGAFDIPYDGIDQDCDGKDAVIDNDGDGYDSNHDCNDNDASIHPGATEVPYDGIDQNCDGSDLIIDNDNDGYDSRVDCNDNDASIHLGAVEIPYDSIDQDCDGSDLTIDNDGDGYNSNIDCNDNNASINPGAEDIPYDGIDQNCDGTDGIIDADGDGYDSNYDCNDNDASIHPGTAEIPNDGIDQDCDGEDLIVEKKDEPKRGWQYDYLPFDNYDTSDWNQIGPYTMRNYEPHQLDFEVTYWTNEDGSIEGFVKITNGIFFNEKDLDVVLDSSYGQFAIAHIPQLDAESSAKYKFWTYGKVDSIDIVAENDYTKEELVVPLSDYSPSSVEQPKQTDLDKWNSMTQPLNYVPINFKPTGGAGDDKEKNPLSRLTRFFSFGNISLFPLLVILLSIIYSNFFFGIGKIPRIW